MECHKIRPFLDDFAEGELGFPQKEMVEEHLRTCSSCREEVSATRRAIRLMMEFGEVDEPRDFLQQVRERIAAPQKCSVLERVLRRPLMARVLVSFGCVALVGFGAWCVFKQFSSPPASTAKHRPEASTTPKVIARARTEIERSLTGTTGEPTPATPPTEEKALRLSYLEPKDTLVPGKSGEASRRERNRQTFATATDREGEDPSTARSLREGAGGTLFGKFVATLERGSEQTSDETRMEIALGSESAMQKKANGATVLLSDDVSETSPQKVSADAAVALWGNSRAKGEAAKTGNAKPAAVTPVPTTRAIAGTGAIAEQPVHDRIAGFETEGLSEPESPLHASDRGLPKRSRAPADETAKDVGDRTNGRGDARLRVEEAQNTETPFYGAARRGSETAGKKKSEAVSFEYDNALPGASNSAVQTEEGLFALEPAQTLNADGDLDTALGATINLDRYHRLGQAVPQVTLNVKDRNKALIEIKKFVEDRGGRVQPIAEQGSKPASGRTLSETALVLVALTPDAYRQFEGKYTLRRVSRGSSPIESQFGEAEERMELEQQQQPVVILLIRLVEMSPQAQPQQPLQQ